jgi:hypothetical protein
VTAAKPEEVMKKLAESAGMALLFVSAGIYMLAFATMFASSIADQVKWNRLAAERHQRYENLKLELSH